MNHVILYIIIITIIILFNILPFSKPMALEINQFFELLFGSIFIIIFYGCFGSILTSDYGLMRSSIIISTYFVLWYYISYKIINYISSDKNGVIRY